jgi:hypothetical protein
MILEQLREVVDDQSIDEIAITDRERGRFSLGDYRIPLIVPQSAWN